MESTMFQSILWIAAGMILVLFLARRRKRKLVP